MDWSHDLGPTTMDEYWNNIISDRFSRNLAWIVVEDNAIEELLLYDI